MLMSNIRFTVHQVKRWVHKKFQVCGPSPTHLYIYCPFNLGLLINKLGTRKYAFWGWREDKKKYTELGSFWISMNAGFLFHKCWKGVCTSATDL